MTLGTVQVAPYLRSVIPTSKALLMVIQLTGVLYLGIVAQLAALATLQGPPPYPVMAYHVVP